jgi:vacuolar protein sorting-associated protein 13A/C
VLIEDLFLLAGPRIETSYDANMEEEREQKSKQEKLETAEIFAASVENQLSDDIHQESFTTQLVTKIVDNLQITIKNIHIRFEDHSSNPNRLFSIGLTLKSLTAVSTDENWVESFIVNPQDAVNKLVSLDNFAVYWNTRESSLQKLTFEEFIVESRSMIDDESNSYILKPVSGVGKATLNKFLKEGIPKTILDVFFDAFALNINYEQYFDILSLLASLSAAQRALPYRKYRPVGNVPMVDLFKYAATCFQADIHARNKRRAWTFVLQRRADRKEYVNLYSNKIMSAKLLENDLERLEEIERRTDFEDLLHYRTLARAFAKKSQANSPAGVQSRIWGWLGYKAAANVGTIN